MTRLCNFCSILRSCHNSHRVHITSRTFSDKNLGLFKAKQNRNPHKKNLKMDPIKNFCNSGDYSIFARSISGLETTVVVRGIKDEFSICFDMGVACHENTGCDKVLISHGHMDHISAVPQHVAKRNLLGLKMANYYVPPHLIQNLKKVCEIFHDINEGSDALKTVEVIALSPGENLELGKGHYVIPFRTVHRVESQGYILYKRHKRLKEDYSELKGPEIGALIREGVAVHDVEVVPEVAFTGDTTFELFLDQQDRTPTPDLFRVRLLIVEATYIDLEDGKDMIKQARDRGHIHLLEIFENAELFRNIEKILLIHFSDKYSGKHIEEQVFSNVPELLKDKVLVATPAGIKGSERHLKTK